MAFQGGKFEYRDPSPRVPHQPDTRVLRVVVTVQDADRTWPPAFDAFFEVPATEEKWYDLGPERSIVKGAEPLSIQSLVRFALHQAAR